MGRRSFVFFLRAIASVVSLVLVLPGDYRPAHASPSEVSDDAIIEAFQAEPTISDKLSHYEQNGFSDDGLGIFLLNKVCSKTGCSQMFLVIQSYSKEGEYAQFFSVLGAVNVSAEGEVSHVNHVNLPIRLSAARPIRGSVSRPAPVTTSTVSKPRALDTRTKVRVEGRVVVRPAKRAPKVKLKRAKITH